MSAVIGKAFGDHFAKQENDRRADRTAQDREGKGIDKVLITCESWNMPSAKSIINNGGILENEVEVEGKIFQRYWVDISK